MSTRPPTVEDPLPGERDTGLRAADVLAAGIPGAELHVAADVGHSPQEGEPDAWPAVVDGHLALA